MARSSFLLLTFGFAILSCLASADVVEHTFHVGNLTIERLCRKQVIIAVNGKLPGPIIRITEGDTVIVHVFNESPYNLTLHWHGIGIGIGVPSPCLIYTPDLVRTDLACYVGLDLADLADRIHSDPFNPGYKKYRPRVKPMLFFYYVGHKWHGVFQLQSAWADGPAYVTQCPIMPGNNYTYKFNVTKQEGTLFWHAHFSWLRATVYGAFIIYPRSGNSYTYDKPYAEVPILLGEWWNANVMDVVAEAIASGGGGNVSDAFTINGQPGDFYPCSKNQTYKLTVVPGKRYLLRIINAAMNNELFFKIADHNFTVVGIDSSYTEPYYTDVVVIAPGQTTDVLLTTNRTLGRYYMAASAYISTKGVQFDPTTTTGIIEYVGANTSSVPQMPVLPYYSDTATAYRFYSNLTSLKSGCHWIWSPQCIDEQMFVTEGLGLTPCGNNGCATPYRFAASMNNVSFQFPSTLSLMQAYYYNVSGIYTADFPNQPPVVFDYTNANPGLDIALAMTVKGIRVKQLKFNATVQMVFQNTAILTTENHPIHLHGMNFFVVGQGFGNYDNNTDPSNFNLVNPQQRNTIAVPAGGWAVIRFQANNPGVWFMHCHFDLHLTWGFATAFVVDNGPTSSSILPPPPSDLPQC